MSIERSTRSQAGEQLAPPPLEKLLARTKADANGCLIWQGALDGKGYGNVGRTRDRNAVRRNWIVHRLVYELTVGPIPAGHELHHRCHVKACVNPEHLVPLTRKQHHGKGGEHPGHMRRAIDASVEARKRRVAARAVNG